MFPSFLLACLSIPDVALISLPLIKYWWGEPLQRLWNQEPLVAGCCMGRDDGGLQVQGGFTQVEGSKS